MRVTVVDLQVHLRLRALPWAGAFAKPRIVADSILAGSKFCNAHARNMLYGILEDVHRPVPAGQGSTNTWMIWLSARLVARRQWSSKRWKLLSSSRLPATDEAWSSRPNRQLVVRM